MIKNILFIVLTITSVNLFSQSFDRSYLHHDLMINYGMATPDLFNKTSSSMLDEKFPDERYIRDNYSGSGIFGLSYRNVLQNEMILLGISANYNKTKCEIYNVGQYEGVLNRTFFTVAVDVQYRYQNMQKVQIYSGVGIGYTFGNETFTPESIHQNQNNTGTINSFAWQINAIGIRVGKAFGGFVEFGYGYKGIVNFGLSFQLY